MKKTREEWLRKVAAKRARAAEKRVLKGKPAILPKKVKKSRYAPENQDSFFFWQEVWRQKQALRERLGDSA